VERQILNRLRTTIYHTQNKATSMTIILWIIGVGVVALAPWSGRILDHCGIVTSDLVAPWPVRRPGLQRGAYEPPNAIRPVPCSVTEPTDGRQPSQEQPTGHGTGVGCGLWWLQPTSKPVGHPPASLCHNIIPCTICTLCKEVSLQIIRIYRVKCPKNLKMLNALQNENNDLLKLRNANH